jgi:hypothetical protein
MDATAGADASDASAAEAGGPIQYVNAGGPMVAPFDADRGFIGGMAVHHPNAIDVSRVVDPAPAAVYQTARSGSFTYKLDGFAPGTSHLVRLHFAETYFAGAGRRLCTVTANAAPFLSAYDIFATAGAMNRANVQEVTVSANASGALVFVFTPTADNCLLSGVEVR